MNGFEDHKSGTWWPRLRHRVGSASTLVGRYLGVGIVVMALDYLVFLLGLQMGATAVQSNAVGRLVTTVVGALLHRRYTFAGPQRMGILRQVMAYFALSGMNLAISTGLILLFAYHMDLAPLLAKMLADVVIIAISMVVGRFLIFAPAR